MSYRYALEAAGAVVHAFEEFGSYQGDWFAKVTHNGVTGWVTGSFGSCSGCDAWSAEFDCYDNFEEESFEEYCREKEWVTHDDDGAPSETVSDTPEWRLWWASKRDEYLERVREFGANYLEDIKTQEEVEAEVAENAEWDMGAEDALKFLRENAIADEAAPR